MFIRKLKIFTSNLSEQKKFYTEDLGFKIVSESERYFELEFGTSMLRMEYHNKSLPAHFAFNIPNNKLKEAKEWLSTKTKLLKNEEGDQFRFESWNADAIYFYDFDNNIVEFIARKNIPNATKTKFSSEQILSISEIGIVHENLNEIKAKINEQLNLKTYSGGLPRFEALGNENGLFIMVNPLLKKWFPKDDEAHINDFVALVENRSTMYKIQYLDGMLSINKDS